MTDRAQLLAQLARVEDQNDRQSEHITALWNRISVLTRQRDNASNAASALETENRGLRRRLEELESPEYWAKRLFEETPYG